MSRDSLQYPKVGKAQETMLSGGPVKIGWDCNTSKPIVFYGYQGFLINAILEAGPKPRVDVTRNIDGSCGNKVVPVDTLMPMF
jgi:hypothetical protein